MNGNVKIAQGSGLIVGLNVTRVAAYQTNPKGEINEN